MSVLLLISQQAIHHQSRHVMSQYGEGTGGKWGWWFLSLGHRMLIINATWRSSQMGWDNWWKAPQSRRGSTYLKGRGGEMVFLRPADILPRPDTLSCYGEAQTTSAHPRVPGGVQWARRTLNLACHRLCPRRSRQPGLRYWKGQTCTSALWWPCQTCTDIRLVLWWPVALGQTAQVRPSRTLKAVSVETRTTDSLLSFVVYPLQFLFCTSVNHSVTPKRKISTSSKYLLPGQGLCNSVAVQRCTNVPWNPSSSLWNFSQSIHRMYFSATYFWSSQSIMSHHSKALHTKLFSCCSFLRQLLGITNSS